MIGGLTDLILATCVFIGAHFILSIRPFRDPLVARLGSKLFLVFYSIAVALPFIWMVQAYRVAPTVDLWIAPTGIKHISLSVMVLASILAVAGLSPNNPALAGLPPPRLSDGPKGIFRVTRHPLMWGVALWAITHLMANGDAASVVLFGGFALLAIGGTLHADARKRRLLGAEWDLYAAQSSHLPFLAIVQGRTRWVWAEIAWRPVILGFTLYLAMLLLHEPVIGIAPVSLVAGIFG